MPPLLLKSLANLFFPDCCPVCRHALANGEQYLCLRCHAELPRIGRKEGKMEEVERLFLGCRNVVEAVSFFRYDRNSPYAEILKDIKYHNRPAIAREMAKEFSLELLETDFFNDIDLILPVPLHRSKQMKRGYNQSLFIAKGIAEITNLPIGDNLLATRRHRTQTYKSAEERRRNVANIFAAKGDIAGKRILLVDDVITTGATLSSCCDTLLEAKAGDVKILSLSLAESGL